MAKGDRFWNNESRKENMKAAEAAGQVADSMEVRTALMQRVHRGEITLEQAQGELSAIKRSAKKRGLSTRAQAFRL